ncbi:MAG: glycine-rich protein [Oscillibacter sp.]|nr:glycine-rich protein [Oscillibacter sp.]
MKKLFGCVSVCQIFLPVLLVLCTITGVKANNIRVEGKTRVTGFTGDTAVIEVTLRWDNSWRDDFNWDAAWVFFKYKKRGLENPWQHAYLSSSGHVLSTAAGNEGGGYAYMVGANAGKVNGLYVMRNGISEGNVSVRLQAKWPLNGTGLTKSDFGNALNEIYVAVHAIEMVYVPYGAYYLGDKFSNGSFYQKAQGSPLPTTHDIIDNNSGYEYSIKNAVVTGPVENIADRSSAAAYPNSSLYFNAVGGGWVQIDFKTPKTIRYFGVSAASNYCAGSQDCRPKGNWYLTGSNDSLTWTRLYTGVNTDWWGTGVAYPVQNTLKVTNPGSYRYYRIEMSGAVRTDDGIVIQSIAMTEKELEDCVVDSESALTLSAKNGMPNVSLAASYPKGYAGFYVMKYETSQEQYVEFLNSLTLEQQKARVTNNNFSAMKRGDYVFGDLKNPSCRNGIVFVEQRTPNTPVVFGNNLNPNNDLFSTDDGQTLACNYMSIEDMIAYCSWSGLRPMSELEYEKACRRFYPQVPDKREYAWNTNNGVNRLSSLNDLNFRGDEREQALSYLKNVNSGTTNSINGPVRCGLFATSATNQTQAGATYWAVMEMSGNLKELCANVNYSNLNGGSCGTGVYNANLWDKTATKYGVRGGGFSSPDSLLRTSDRTEAMNYFTTITQRDSTVGFRGVYSLSGIKINGGTIKNTEDTACWSGTEIANVQEAFCPDFSDVRFQYNWYVKKPGEAKFDIIDNAVGITLKYGHFENKTASPVVYTFKRMGICAMGVAESNEVTVKVLPEPFVASSYTFNPCPVAIPHRWTGLQKEWRIVENPDALIVEDGSNLLVNNLTANGIYTLEAQFEKCPDIFTTQINVTNTVILTAATTYGYTGKAQCVVLPAGKYKVEAWGARGASVSGYFSGGNGGYTKGEITLVKVHSFYIYIGQAGQGSGKNITWPVTFNGGGAVQAANIYSIAGSGGGASDVRIVYAAWNNSQSLKSRIMVAAGGGGGFWWNNVGSRNGGAGGGLVGNAGAFMQDSHRVSSTNATGGSQTSGGLSNRGYAGSPNVGRWAIGGSGSVSSGGGGGYYGGAGGRDYGYCPSAGAGGSSFISGHNGCNAINSVGSHTGQPIHYSGFYFTNTSMSTGINGGHGQVRITPMN